MADRTLPEHFAETIGATLNIEQIAARASAAAEAAARLRAEPAGTAVETGVSGANSAIAKPSEDRAAAVPPAARDGLLVVSDTEKGAQVFSSCRRLHQRQERRRHRAAIQRARLEEPITISNMNLTIRAGEQFRPVVVFHPESNPVKYPPGMMTIAGGQLHAANVHWELDLPRDVPDDWSLFETRRRIGALRTVHVHHSQSGLGASLISSRRGVLRRQSAAGRRDGHSGRGRRGTRRAH